MNIDEKNLAVYRSLFKGRSDTYAVRWEKEGGSGYMPACELSTL